MDWNLEEAAAYYKKQGAPGDQTALISLLREAQENNSGGIPQWVIGRIAEAYGVKESYLLAVVKRIPSLRLENSHLLELCGGPNCKASLAPFVEKTYGAKPNGFEVKLVGCMRMCGKGPNIRFDGVVYNRADEALIRKLIDGIK